MSKATVSFSWVGLLGVIFVMCKVFEYGPIAEWSWWLVLLPFYIGIAILIGAFVITLVGFGSWFIGWFIKEMWEDRQKRR